MPHRSILLQTFNFYIFVSWKFIYFILKKIHYCEMNISSENSVHKHAKYPFAFSKYDFAIITEAQIYLHNNLPLRWMRMLNGQLSPGVIDLLGLNSGHVCLKIIRGSSGSKLSDDWNINCWFMFEGDSENTKFI